MSLWCKNTTHRFIINRQPTHLSYQEAGNKCNNSNYKKYYLISSLTDRNIQAHRGALGTYTVGPLSFPDVI